MVWVKFAFTTFVWIGKLAVTIPAMTFTLAGITQGSILVFNARVTTAPLAPAGAES
jgi:hypothetical protein